MRRSVFGIGIRRQALAPLLVVADGARVRACLDAHLRRREVVERVQHFLELSLPLD
jgi:hypothetical protein